MLISFSVDVKKGSPRATPGERDCDNPANDHDTALRHRRTDGTFSGERVANQRFFMASISPALRRRFSDVMESRRRWTSFSQGSPLGSGPEMLLGFV
jgi:hypothetical protein